MTEEKHTIDFEDFYEMMKLLTDTLRLQAVQINLQSRKIAELERELQYHSQPINNDRPERVNSKSQ